MRQRILVIVAVVLAAGLLPLASASGSCGGDPDAPPPLRFKQMFRAGKTGHEYYKWLLLGRVHGIRDPGERGGMTVIRLKLDAVGVGSDRRIARVEDWRAPRGMSSSGDFIFERGERYAVVARHRESGRFEHDGVCGQTSSLGRFRYRQLVALAGG